MNKAIFLDRDGTLNNDKGYTYKLEDYRLLPRVIEALNLLKKDFIFFIVTNQSGIARRYYTLKDAERFNDRIVKELKYNDIKIKNIYICPHAPDENCDCRKPGQRFIKEAIKDYDIDIQNSYVIGDHESDILFAKNAGAKSVLVLTGHGKKHLPNMKTEPDYVAENIFQAAKWIIKNEQRKN